jgi:hypothetical protein
VLHRKTSTEFFEDLNKNELFDLIYVDGDHGFVQAFWDMCAFFRHMNENGLFMVDDYSHVQHPDVTLAVNSFIDVAKDNIAKIGYVTGHFKQERMHVLLSQTTFFCTPKPRGAWTDYPLPSLNKYRYTIRQFIYTNKAVGKLILPRKVFLWAKKEFLKYF